jgi:hypothetical protein
MESSRIPRFVKYLVPNQEQEGQHAAAERKQEQQQSRNRLKQSFPFPAAHGGQQSEKRQQNRDSRQYVHVFSSLCAALFLRLFLPYSFGTATRRIKIYGGKGKTIRPRTEKERAFPEQTELFSGTARFAYNQFISC